MDVPAIREELRDMARRWQVWDICIVTKLFYRVGNSYPFDFSKLEKTKHNFSNDKNNGRYDKFSVISDTSSLLEYLDTTPMLQRELWSSWILYEWTVYCKYCIILPK